MLKRWLARIRPGPRSGSATLLGRLQAPGMLERIARVGSYRPRWTAADRTMWNRVDEPTRHFWIERGERYLGFDWPPLEPLYRDYHEAGSRQRFEPTYHRRRQAVTTFVLAEALEHRGRFIEPLLDALDRLCDEPTWVLPAHEKQEVDLFSAETGNLIAWTCYILGGNAAFSASERVPRALSEVRARVVEPYLTRDDYWWMSLNGQKPSNWTTWCTSNCLGTVLLIETDTGRRAAAIEK